MQVRVRDVDFFVTDCRTRLPFRFGAATLTRAWSLVARAEVDAGGGRPVEGFAADLLVPKWFEKDPRKSAREDVENLVRSARAAAAVMTAPALGTRSVFDLWWHTYRECVEVRPPDAADRLVRGFGVALLERAVIDAACRAAGLSFFEALRQDLLAFRPAAVHPKLAGFDLAASLLPAPLARVRVRHTVGLADPLRIDEVAPGDRVGDGLPEALEQDIREYGLDHFKIKIGGDVGRDLERLRAVAAVLDAEVDGRAFCTIDGNEQYGDLADVVRLLERLGETPSGARLLDGLLFVEQPLPREASFDPAHLVAIEALSAFAPLLVDEADSGVGAFERALACGYRGVSVKSCKGVFRALLNRALCERAGGGCFLSGEDLTTLPVLALQQDLALVAALGLGHVERNGHHYFRRLDHLPEREARAALQAHPDLYRAGPAGIGLRIHSGEIEIGSLGCAGFGHGVTIRADERTPLAGWQASGQASGPA